MGGAERGARKRRQQRSAGARAVAQARGRDNRKVIASVLGVILLAAVVAGGVWWTNASKNETADQAIPAHSPSSPAQQTPHQRDGIVVAAGQQDAKVQLDVYADFMCPVCGQFHELYGQQIEEQVAAGTVHVRYHMVPSLNRMSNPPGYSMESANASLCAADQDKFTPFHNSLFVEQPEEGTRGYDANQLAELGSNVDVQDESTFTDCVRGGAYKQQLDTEFQKTANDPKLQQPSRGGGTSFGTPTVLANGSMVQFQDKDWLTKLVQQT